MVPEFAFRAMLEAEEAEVNETFHAVANRSLLLAMSEFGASHDGTESVCVSNRGNDAVQIMESVRPNRPATLTMIACWLYLCIDSAGGIASVKQRRSMFGNAMPPRDVMTPLYFQIFADLKEGIASGRYSEGSFLPSEAELSKSYGVSRITAKRALDELAAASLAVREQGRGTLVQSNMRTRSVQASLGHLVQDLTELSCQIRVVGNAVVQAPKEAREGFGDLCDLPLRCIKRILVGPSGPTSYLTSYLDADGTKHWTKSLLQRTPLTSLLEEAGVRIRRAKESIAAVPASKAASEHLSLRRGAPVLRVCRTVFDQHGECVEYVEAIHRSDRYEYKVSLGS